MPVNTANAVWEGRLRDGSGKMRLGSGSYEGPYSFHSRFESGSGTNPEELIGAAHAGCFSMAFAAGLERAGFPATSVKTAAKVHLEKVESGFAITRIELATEAVVPGIDEAVFQEQAAGAKAGCPVSKALTGVEISLTATLVAG